MVTIGPIRDEFRRMLQSVVANGHTFEECKEVLKQSECDWVCRSPRYLSHAPII